VLDELVLWGDAGLDDIEDTLVDGTVEFANAIATATEFGDETAFRERIVGVGAEKSFGCVLEYLLPTDRVAHAATPSEWSKLLSICLV